MGNFRLYMSKITTVTRKSSRGREVQTLVVYSEDISSQSLHIISEVSISNNSLLSY